MAAAREPDPPLSPAEVAAILNVKRRTVYDLTNSGQLGYYRIGGLKMIPRAEVDRYLAENFHGPK